MKKNLFLFIIFSLVTISSQAAINPEYKECMQRGYSLDREYCVFPNGSKCLITAFNNGTCGQEFMTDDYCVEEGRYVWDSDRCCEGLEPYLKSGTVGQETCRQKGYKRQKEFQNKEFPNKEFENTTGLWLLIGGLIVLFVLLKITGRRRRRKKR